MSRLLHDSDPRSFLRYYHHYQQIGWAEDLLLCRYNLKRKARRPLPYIDNKAKALSKQGMNRYEINHVLKSKPGALTPSLPGVYDTLRRHGLIA